MLPMCKFCQFQFSISNKGGVANWQLTALVMATMAYWQHLTPHHMPRSDATEPIQKGAQRNMFCCAPFVLFLRRVWADGAERIGRGKSQLPEREMANCPNACV